MVAQSNTILKNLNGLLQHNVIQDLYMAIDRANPRRLSSTQIFDQLDELDQFCREQGFRFNPADAWNLRSFIWQQYNKKQQGKNYRNNWLDDLSRLNGRRTYR